MSDLLDAIDRSVRTLTEGEDVAVAFSGGLDSSVVAALAKRHARSAVLYTAGFEDSHDVKASRDASSMLDMEWVLVPMDDASLEDHLRGMVKATGTIDPVVLSFEMPLEHVMSACKEGIVIGGQGADEVFRGYSKYVGLSESELEDMVARDVDALRSITLPHESSMAAHHGKSILYPYLDDRVVEVAGRFPFEEMMPMGDDRKRPLKAVASELGYPDIATRPKKAAQYGSGSMNAIRRLAKSKGMHVSEYVMSLMEGC